MGNWNEVGYEQTWSPFSQAFLSDFGCLLGFVLLWNESGLDRICWRWARFFYLFIHDWVVEARCSARWRFVIGNKVAFISARVLFIHCTILAANAVLGISVWEISNKVPDIGVTSSSSHITASNPMVGRLSSKGTSGNGHIKPWQD